MAPRWTHPVFSVGEAVRTWADVGAFARGSGTWDELVQEVRHGLACERAGHQPGPGAVKEAGNAFRYHRRLISAEETEAWLAARGLTVADWTAYVRGLVLRAEHPDVAPVDGPVEDLDGLVWVTGRCSGRLDEVASELARRMAAHAAVGGDLDSALDAFQAAVVTDEALRRQVDRRRLEWMRVALAEARFATEGAAREAVLCVNDDGLDLERVCELAGASLVRQDALIEDLDAELGPVVLGARPGALVGPVPTPEGFVVARIDAKMVPSMDDPDIRRRAAELTLASALRREVADRVRWHDDV